MPIDHDTLLRILLAERSKVLAYLRTLVRSRELAEDLFQDLCVLALQKREEIQDAQHLAAWLRTAGRFRAMSARRNPHHRQLCFTDAVLDQMEQNWEEHDSVSESAIRDALRNCMAMLPEKAREMVLARYSGGLSVEEIAKQKNRPTKSVYVTFSRIHSALSDCVFRRMGGVRGGVSHA